MSKQSMALALDDRHRPIRISARRGSGSDGAWSGFPVECHVLGPRGRLSEFGIDHVLLGLCIRPHDIALSAVQARRVTDYVHENLGGDIGLSELASQVGLSPHYFSLLFKRAFGVSPYRYILSMRIDRAKRLLSERHMAISEIALELGFADQSHFSKVFKTFVGATPRQYRCLS
jgi:AraC-like DNA-binding protein